jgi:hypothetical protein
LEDLRTQHNIFSARFYCALITLHVSAPFGGHLQAVHKHKKYIQGSQYIFNGSVEETCISKYRGYATYTNGTKTANSKKVNEPPEDGRQTGPKHVV